MPGSAFKLLSPPTPISAGCTDRRASYPGPHIGAAKVSWSDSAADRYGLAERARQEDD